MDKKRNYVILVIVVISLGLLLTGGTYAWLTFGTTIGNNFVDANTTCFVIDYDGGSGINGLMFQSNTPKGGLSTAITMKVNDSCYVDGTGTLTLNVFNGTSSVLLSEGALKYAVYENVNSSPVSSGVISSTGDMDIYSGFYVSSISKTYYVYIWLDGNIADNDYLDVSFSGDIHSSVIQNSYQPIEYIQSSGTQYINTGYYWQNENIEIYFDGTVLTNASNQSLFGNEEYLEDGTRNFAGIPHGANGSYGIYIGSSSQGSVSTTIGTRFNLNIKTTTSKQLSVYKDGTRVINKTYSGSVLTKSTARTNRDATGKIHLFSNSNIEQGGAIQHISAMRVYSFKLYDNDVLVRNFVPVKNASGVAGMYDTVTNVFYKNSGSGSFIAGPEL